MSYDNHEEKIRKGQAYNLAVAQAIHEGKADDNKHIYGLFIKFYDLGGLLQKASLDEIRQVISE